MAKVMTVQQIKDEIAALGTELPLLGSVLRGEAGTITPRLQEEVAIMYAARQATQAQMETAYQKVMDELPNMEVTIEEE